MIKKKSYANQRFMVLVGVAAFLLSGCASGIQEDTPVIKTAKACQRAKESDPGIIPPFKITACTHTGVWMVDEYDDMGQLVKRFDFLNQEYAGPESQGIFMPVALMGNDAPERLRVIRQAINSKLLALKS